EQPDGQIASRGHRVGVLLRDELEREVEHPVEPGLARPPLLEQRLRRAREKLPRGLRAFAAPGAGGDDGFQALLLQILLELRRLERDRALETSIRDEAEPRQLDVEGSAGAGRAPARERDRPRTVPD